MALPEAIADLAIMADPNRGRDKFVSYAEKYVNYHMMPNLMREKKISFKGGNGCNFNAVMDHNNGAKHVEPYEVESGISRTDTTKRGFVPWRISKTQMAIDETEMAIADGPEEILDVLDVETFRSELALWELLEDAWWQRGATTSSNSKAPFPLNYWVYTQADSSDGAYSGDHATTGEGAFLTKNHNSWSGGPGGIDVTANTKYANWNCAYTNVTKDDLFTKMRRAYFETDWGDPIPHPSYHRSGHGRCIYSKYQQVAEAERVAENQNENLGNDMASKDGLVTFRRHPWKPVHALKDQAQDYVYMIDWSWFGIAGNKNYWMVRKKLREAPNQPTVLRGDTYTMWNTICYNRRAQSVFSKT